MNIGDKISVCRQNLRMTQEELAARLGVTPQAVSKWERGQSYPDIFTFAQLCQALGVSADLLLETERRNLTESSDMAVNDEIRKILRESQEPLALEIGMGLVDVFMRQPFIKYVEEQRIRLAREGILLPIVRIRDDAALEDKEFMVLSYHRVLYSGQPESVGDDTPAYIVKKLAEVIRENYGYILNQDMVKIIIDNLKVDYPALITGVIPEVISYSALQKVMTGLLARGDGLCYMVKTIEVMQEKLRMQPNLEPEELVAAVAEEIEREDNFRVFMERRRQKKQES